MKSILPWHRRQQTDAMPGEAMQSGMFVQRVATGW
jgi:hypothetical protein